MKSPARVVLPIIGCLTLALTTASPAQDWPQWRGPNRDGKAVGFKAPGTWPKELKQRWKVPVGDGVATPALIGDKLYVFTRQQGNEVTRCLDASSGNEIWQDKYPAAGVSGPASGFSGPRCSPTVAQGKVLTLGVQGTLSCLEADTGKVLWRKQDFQGSVPRFATSSSPIVLDGLCIAQLGGDRNGVIVAYDLTTGAEKWKWSGESPAYGSPVPMTVGGTRAIVTPTERSMVVVGSADGKVLFKMDYSQGRYNASTAIVDGDRIIYAGPARGMTAEKLIKDGDKFTAQALWKNPDNSLMFNTPVLKDDLIFGISGLNSLFCINAQNGQTAWTSPLGPGGSPPPGQGQGGPQGKRGRGPGGAGGYGSIVDAGTVIFGLTPAAELVVFEPSGQEFKRLASYKLASGGTYAHPVLFGNTVCIKDQDSLTLWTIE